ncbi:Protein of unknown function [Gryllus bimaculatus]|nr:Protein of unknown function [Gryllus bimaculatus]
MAPCSGSDPNRDIGEMRSRVRTEPRRKPRSPQVLYWFVCTIAHVGANKNLFVMQLMRIV